MQNPTVLAPLTVNSELNEDGSVTLTLVYPGNRVETDTVYPSSWKVVNGVAQPPKPKGEKAAKKAKSTEPFDEKVNAKLPKTQRRYLAPNGKWVSYARARQIGCLTK